ncbi:MAG: hypothetical protein DMG97_28380 [Acidobacteria bacterium]|nr:MAG: hypothetical protein DMG97_28380 [Acidobacteriota bacterium]
MTAREDYYVYVYIDPRNYEKFYYGKGCGSRKDIHLKDTGKSPKARQIAAIRKAGCLPIVRVIARGLTQDQALLIEATLLWQLGKFTTNLVAGHNSRQIFREHDTLHRNEPGFDFSRRIHFFNMGNYEHRCWDDCRTHGFVSAGYGARYRDQAKKLQAGDIVVVYLIKKGYVGVGRVLAEAVPAREFRVGKTPLRKLRLKAPKMLHDSDDLENCEYVVRVKWLVANKQEDALWKPGLFTTQLVRASLDNQPKTRRYIEDNWNVRFEDLLAEGE